MTFAGCFLEVCENSSCILVCNCPKQSVVKSDILYFAPDCVSQACLRVAGASIFPFQRLAGSVLAPALEQPQQGLLMPSLCLDDVHERANRP